MDPPRAARTHLGLRVQILLALLVAFVIAFGLFDLALVRLTQRGRLEDRVRDAQPLADALAAQLGRPGSDATTAETLDAAAQLLLPGGAVRGIELRRGDLEPMTRGVTGLGEPVDATTAAGDRLRLWVRAPKLDSSPHLSLMLSYVAVSGGLILLLAYLALTGLIVRPLEAVSRATTRLAEGQLDTVVPVRGAAEVAELAASFNRMASQLARDRDALERRLRELEETTAQLESAQAQVVRGERLASVGRLSAGIAHEIGNPLAAMLGLLELLQEGGLDAEDERELIGRVQSETERIHVIIRELLDFARGEGGEGVEGGEDSEARVDLKQTVEETLRLVEKQSDARDVKITLHLPPEIQAARLSPDRATQVVLNLVLNALDVLDGVDDPEVRVTLAADTDPTGAEKVTLRVEDNGPGVPEEVREHLFEPFVTTKPTGKGTGLGLSVVHGIVERAGGRVGLVEGALGGAAIEVELPAATDAAGR